MRDDCTDGKGDVKAFEVWCYESFPNRVRKEIKEQSFSPKPKYAMGDIVVFECGDELKNGVIEEVNKNIGTEHPSGVYYEIYVAEDETIYAEVAETEITRKIGVRK